MPLKLHMSSTLYLVSQVQALLRKVVEMAYTADDFAYEFSSVIRGHHVYKSIVLHMCTRTIGDGLGGVLEWCM